MAHKKMKLPGFENDREEHGFWGCHSVETFAEELDELDVVIRPARTAQIALRLSKEDVETLRSMARTKGIGHTTLAREIVEQWLARSRRKGRATGSARQSSSSA